MANDVYSFAILGNVAVQPVCNVFHYESEEENAANPITPCSEMYLAWQGIGNLLELYRNCLPNNYFVTGIRIRRINNGGGPNVTGTNSEPGTRPSAADVSGVGPVTLLHLNSPGGDTNWSTGKIFWPGVGIGDITNNQFDGALKTAIDDFMEAFSTPIGGGPHGPYKPRVWSVQDAVARPWLAWTLSGKVGTQRRRYVPI